MPAKANQISVAPLTRVGLCHIINSLKFSIKPIKFPGSAVTIDIRIQRNIASMPGTVQMHLENLDQKPVPEFRHQQNHNEIVDGSIMPAGARFSLTLYRTYRLRKKGKLASSTIHHRK